LNTADNFLSDFPAYVVRQNQYGPLPFDAPVPLAAIRYDKRLSGLPLIRQSQLSVMPLSKDEFETISTMGKSKKGKK